MESFKKSVILLLGVLSLSAIFIPGAAASGLSSEKDAPQTQALWTESKPHSMETKTSVAVEGTLEAVSGKNMLTVRTGDDGKVDLLLDTDTKITIGTEEKTIADLTRGMKIKARYAERNGKNIAIAIEAEEKAK